MKKIAIIVMLFATLDATAATPKCSGNETEKMICQYNKGSAPKYFVGCYEYAAQIDGEQRAAEICTANYYEHKAYQAVQKAKRIKGA